MGESAHGHLRSYRTSRSAPRFRAERLSCGPPHEAATGMVALSTCWRVRPYSERRLRVGGGAQRTLRNPFHTSARPADFVLSRETLMKSVCAARGAGLPGRPRSGSRRPGAAQVVASSRPGVYGSAVVGDMATVLSSAVSAHALKKNPGSACQGSGVFEN